MPRRSAYASMMSLKLRDLPHEAALRIFVDAYWDAMSPTGVSWAGFYLPDASNTAQLVLGPSRDKPACSPIGMHGACGQCFTSCAPLVVTDVANLGAGYIACDPKDRSELVVPLFAPGGVCVGVFDVDSHDLNAFTRDDAVHTLAALRNAGLSHHGPMAESMAGVRVV